MKRAEIAIPGGSAELELFDDIGVLPESRGWSEAQTEDSAISVSGLQRVVEHLRQSPISGPVVKAVENHKGYSLAGLGIGSSAVGLFLSRPSHKS